MNKPRPTMTPEDIQSVRDFLNSPTGIAMVRKMHESYGPRPLIDTEQPNFWRASPKDALPFPDGVEDEASNAIPPDSSRTFRPMFLARRVSYWPIIIITILATTSCAIMIGWFVSAALEGHA